MIVPPRDLGAGAAALWRYAAAPIGDSLEHRSLAARATTDERGPQLATPANIVDLVICILSFLGALAIILPYLLNKRARKLRHSLILGLATSDLVTSLIIIASTSFLLAGGDLANSKRFCDFVGYSLASSIFSQHLWNMGIAIVTYMILVHPLNNVTALMERHLIWLWPIIWGISLIVNGISWRIAGWSNAGGFCAFGNQGGRYYGAIISFVPRGLVVVIIIVLYTHLFFFLRRTNLFSAVSHRSASQEAGNGTRGRIVGRTSLRADSDESSRAPVSRSRRPSNDPSLHHLHQMDGERSNAGTMSRRTSFPTGLLRYIPTFNSSRRGSAASSSSKRADSASTQTPKDVFLSGAEDEGMEMGECNRQRILSFATTPSSPPRSNEGASSDGRHQSARPEIGIVEPDEGPVSMPSSPQQPRDETFSSTAQLVEPPRPGNARRPSTADDAGGRPRPAKLSLAARHVSASIEPRADAHDDDTAADDESDDFSLDPYKPLQRMKPRRDVRDFQMISSPREHLKHYALSPMRTQGVPRPPGTDSGSMSHPASPRTAKAPLDPTSEDVYEGREKGVQPRFDDMLGEDWTWGMEVGGQDTSAAPAPVPAPHVRHAGSRKDRKRSKWWRHSSRHAGGLGGHDRTDANGVASTGSTVDEHGVESLGSTLNRQASVLMLLYPLAYCLLFSVSIARIITDFTRPAPVGRVKDPNEPLRAVSRWFIFAQGAFDAIIFQIVERHFRKRMKRKRQIAAGEAVPQTWWERLRDYLMLRQPPPSASATAPSQ